MTQSVSGDGSTPVSPNVWLSRIILVFSCEVMYMRLPSQRLLFSVETEYVGWRGLVTNDCRSWRTVWWRVGEFEYGESSDFQARSGPAVSL